MNELKKFCNILLFNKKIKIDFNELNKYKLNFGLFCKINNNDIPLNMKIKIAINKQNNEVKFNKYIKFIDLLNEQKINYLIIKGPTLSFYNYDNIYLREYKDIDLYINKNHYEQAIKLFIDYGFENGNIKLFNKSNISITKKLLYSKGDDNFFFYKDIGFEVKDFIRFIDGRNSKVFENSKIKMNIGNHFYFTTNLETTFIIMIIYVYNIFFTEYGINHKLNLSSILELSIFIEKYKKNLDIGFINKQIKTLKIINLFKEVNNFYYKLTNCYILYKKTFHFGKYNLNIKNVNKIYNQQLFYKNFIKKIFYTTNINCIKQFIGFEKFNNIGNHRNLILRNYANNKKSYYEYSLFNNNNKIHLFFSYPYKLENITFEIVFININCKKATCNISFYANEIYEIRSKIPIAHLFKYYANHSRCIHMIFNNDNILENQFIFKINLRKISSDFYPFMDDENKPYLKFAK